MSRSILLAAFCLAIAATPALTDEPHAAPPTAAPLVGAALDAARALDGFKAAVSAGNAAAAAVFLADDALIFEQGSVEHSKAAYAASHLLADAEFSKAVTGVVTRRTGGASGDLAWISSEGRTTGRYKDRDVDRVTTETAVLRKDRAGWRIVHLHWSSRAPAR